MIILKEYEQSISSIEAEARLNARFAGCTFQNGNYMIVGVVLEAMPYSSNDNIVFVVQPVFWKHKGILKYRQCKVVRFDILRYFDLEKEEKLRNFIQTFKISKHQEYMIPAETLQQVRRFVNGELTFLDLFKRERITKLEGAE